MVVGAVGGRGDRLSGHVAGGWPVARRALGEEFSDVGCMYSIYKCICSPRVNSPSGNISTNAT